MKVNYSLSRDYEKLFSLIQTNLIICFVDYSTSSGIKLRDVAKIKYDKEREHISVGARGISYIEAFAFDGRNLKEDFIFQCEVTNLEYVIPNSPIPSVNVNGGLNGSGDCV